MQEEIRKQNDRNNEDVDDDACLNKLVEGRRKKQSKCELIIEDQFEVTFQIDTGVSINMLPAKSPKKNRTSYTGSLKMWNNESMTPREQTYLKVYNHITKQTT